MSGRHKHWYSGIGKIVSGLNADAQHSVKLAPIQFANPGKLDLLRAIRTRYQKGERPKKIRLEINFAPTRTLAELDLIGLSDKDIANRMQEDYIDAFENK